MISKLKISNSYFILALISLGANSIFGQPFAIGHTTINFIDSSRGNRSIATEIYYPSDITGDNFPITAINSDKFPVLIFGHGFLMTWDTYKNIWEVLVSRGFIMAFPKTEGGLAPSHMEYGKDLAFVNNQMNNLGLLASSIFYERISTMNAVMGHSMGGGAAFIAAGLDDNIKTIVTLAPAETNPSAIESASLITIPALVIAGTNDCVTPPITNQLPMYNSLISNCKTYISIIGGSHCQMANSNFFCNFGENTCSPSPEIDRSEQHLILNDYLIKWLNAQLKNDCESGGLFNETIDTDTRITFQKNCLQCTNLGNENDWSNVLLKLYPIPFDSELNIETSFNEWSEITIFDSAFRKLIDQKFKKSTTVLTSNLADGTYFYEIKSANKNLKRGLIVKKQ